MSILLLTFWCSLLLGPFSPHFLLFTPPITSSCSLLPSLPLVHSSPHFLLFTPPLTSSCSLLPSLPPVHSSPHFLLFTPPLTSSCSLLPSLPLVHSSPHFLSFTPRFDSSPFPPFRTILQTMLSSLTRLVAAPATWHQRGSCRRAVTPPPLPRDKPPNLPPPNTQASIII